MSLTLLACEGTRETEVASLPAPLRTGALLPLHRKPPHHRHHHAHACPAHPGVPTETCGWSSFDDGLSGTSADFVFFDTRARGVVYALSGGFIWRSSDGGETFSPLADVGARVTALRGDGPDPAALMAATQDGIVTSDDSGATWQKHALAGLNVTQLDNSLVQPQRQVMVVDSDGPMLTSYDSGTHWFSQSANYPRGATFSLSVDPRTPLDVLTVVEEFDENAIFGTTRCTVSRTQDGGLTWHKVHAPGESLWALTRCQANPDVLLAGSHAQVWRSNDNGVTWSASPVPAGAGVTHLAINPRDCDDYYALQEQLGPVRTRDGGKSFGPPLTQGLDVSRTGSFPGSLAIDPEDTSHLILATHAAFFASHDSGEHWSRVPAMMHMDVSALAASARDPSRLWLVSWGQGAWRRDGSTAPWTPIGLDQLSADFLTGIQLDATSGRVVVGAIQGQFSPDGEQFAPIPLDGPILGAAFDPRDPGLIYLATQVHGVVKSSDGGASWRESNTGIEPWATRVGVFITVRALALNPGRPQQLFAVTDGAGIYRSDDAAASWTRVFESPDPGHCALVVPGNPSRVYTCMSGVTGSLDGGQTWSRMNEGLDSLFTRAFAHDADSDTLFVSTASGVYKRSAGAAEWELVDPDCAMPSTALTIMQEGGRKHLVAAGEHGVRRHAL